MTHKCVNQATRPCNSVGVIREFDLVGVPK